MQGVTFSVALFVYFIIAGDTPRSEFLHYVQDNKWGMVAKGSGVLWIA
jgi:hypothetical protein